MIFDQMQREHPPKKSAKNTKEWSKTALRLLVQALEEKPIPANGRREDRDEPADLPPS